MKKMPKYVLEEKKNGLWKRVGDVIDTSTKTGKVAFATANFLLKRVSSEKRRKNRLRKME